MSLNPLAPVTDYQSSLNRIFWFTSLAALAATSMIQAHIPEVKHALIHLDEALGTSIDDMLPIRAGILLPAITIGLLARIYRLHGRISHWLGISERFDIDIIIPEFAKQLGIEPDSISEAERLEHRHDIMREAFYRFTGSHSPEIDSHLVYQAIDLWSWFWSGVQSAAIFIVTGLVLIATRNYQAGGFTILLTISLSAVGLPAIRRSCRRYALAQVKSIMSDPLREATVRKAFPWAAEPIVPLRRSA